MTDPVARARSTKKMETANIMVKVLQVVEEVSKFLLCVLLTQLGKTFTAVGRIIDEILRDGEEGRSIHLVWTMNTLLNNTQFSNRLHCIELEYGIGSVIVFSSKNIGGRYKHVKNLNELQGICMDLHTCPRVIVMCNNDTRLDDGFTFINILNSNTTNISRVFAYYDELHKYINDKLRDQIEEIDRMDIVKGILALTATPEKILLKTGYWSKINMIQLKDYNENDYAGCGDMAFIVDDIYFPASYKRPALNDFDQLDNDIIGFVQYTLNKYPTILEKGSRTFIPAHIRRTGHQRIRNDIFQRCPNAVIVVLNGEEKNMKYRDTIHFTDSNGVEKTIQLMSPTEEVCETIYKVIKENRLDDRPLVITGFLCVGMGQTLIHSSLGTFTSAILSHLDLTNDDLYQLFGRLTARSKNWGIKYVKTNVYCPTKTMQRVCAMEECARNLAKEHNGGTITEEIYRAPLSEMGEVGAAALENIRVKKEKKIKKIKPEIIEHDVAFSTQAQVDVFLTNIYKKPVQVRSFVERDKYTISTRLPSYYKKKKEMLVGSDRLTKEFYDKIKLSTNISAKQGSGQPFMVYPVYSTDKSATNDFKYYVRYLKPSDANPTVNL